MSITEKIDIRFPKTLADALRLQASGKTRGKLLAGGTDLLVQWASGVPVPERATSLWDLPGLCEIEIRDDDILVGSGVTHAFLVEAKPIHRHLPAPIAAARTVGAAQIQARGTPWATPPTPPLPAIPPRPPRHRRIRPPRLLAGTREVPDRFWTGYRQIDARPDERPRLPPPEKGTATTLPQDRHPQGPGHPARSYASRIRVKNGVIQSAAIALGSIALPRAPTAEAFLAGKSLTPG